MIPFISRYLDLTDFYQLFVEYKFVKKIGKMESIKLRLKKSF